MYRFEKQGSIFDRVNSFRAHLAASAAAGLLLMVGCGTPELPSPLQSALGTPTVVPTATVAPTPTRAGATVAVAAATPNIAATNAATAATVTALAAPPTRAASQTPLPTRQVRGAGPGDGLPTPLIKIIASSGVSVVSAAAQVIRGGPGSVTIKTRPGAVCQLTTLDATTYASRPIAKVAPQTAASDGGAAWIWIVDAAAPLGALRMKVDCGPVGTTVFEVQVEL